MADPIPTKVVVKAGEQHVTRIAGDAGFRSIAPVWDAPENAALRRARVNPNTLAPNDIVVVPAPDPRSDDRPTGRTNVFTVVSEALQLTLRLQDEAQRPLASRACQFVAGKPNAAGRGTRTQPPFDAVSDAKGSLTANVGRTVTEGELTVHADGSITSAIVARIRLVIGALDPPSTVSGQRSRLNNMGYFAGFSANDTAQLQWAIEEFQADNKLRVNGRSDDRDTFNKIAHEHGDLLAGETVP